MGLKWLCDVSQWQFSGANYGHNRSARQRKNLQWYNYINATNLFSSNPAHNRGLSEKF
jgi:hypothetical protein